MRLIVGKVALFDGVRDAEAQRQIGVLLEALGLDDDDAAYLRRALSELGQ